MKTLRGLPGEDGLYCVRCGSIESLRMKLHVSDYLIPSWIGDLNTRLSALMYSQCMGHGVWI